MASAALLAVTEQTPVPLVMVTNVATFEQAPDAAKLTAPVPLPPVDPTVKVAFMTCAVTGTPVTASADWLAWLTTTSACAVTPGLAVTVNLAVVPAATLLATFKVRVVCPVKTVLVKFSVDGLKAPAGAVTPGGRPVTVGVDEPLPEPDAVIVTR